MACEKVRTIWAEFEKKHEAADGELVLCVPVFPLFQALSLCQAVVATTGVFL